MVSKLPRWVIVGGVALSGMAGYINAVGFISAQHQAISHLTGAVSQLAINLALQDLARAAHLALVVLSFFIGCVISGVLIRQSTLQLGRRYGAALLLESILLILAVQLLQHNIAAGDYLATMALGIQNAMASTYSGALIRTTHLTGFVTDFGIAIGHLLRGLPIDKLRFRLYAFIFASFLAGGILGAWSYLGLGIAALYVPAILLGALGLTYLGVEHYLRQRRVLPPSDAVESDI